jgi:hypothetical protein
MSSHKIYGYCKGCYEGIISVIKSKKRSNKDTLYLCPKCKKYNVFEFKDSEELEKRINKRGE